MPVLNLQRDFLERRRVQLERYLRALLENPAICRSRELRAFLSQQQLLPNVAGSSAEVDSKDFVTRIYNSVTDGMEEFLGNVPVLDQLSVAGQNLISAAATQLSIANATGVNALGKEGRGDGEVADSKEAEAELARYAAASTAALAAEEPPPFVKPLCDIFLEAFELNRENNWLRGRAVVFVLQQLLGGTVERKIRENLRGMIFSEQAFAKMLDWILDAVWPGGKRFVPKVRTPQDKTKSRKDAGVVLAQLVPELVGSVVGRHNASSAARRVLAMLNNERLMANLVFEIFDEVVEVVFGEGVVKP
jgi:sorting nexin-25